MAGSGGARHVAENLRAEGLPAVYTPELEDPVMPGEAVVTVGPFVEGLVDEQLRLVLTSERDLTGKSGARRGAERKMPSRRRNVVDPLQLRPGDHVVHAHHGVGRFVEMTSRTVGTGAKRATREYLVIEYAPSKKGQPGDRLYVPSDQLDQVTKYVGGEDPSVNRMGGADWAKTKSKARKAIREIADELVRLYSARQSAPGHAFGPDTPWQRELEDSFEFVETPDQLVTIDDVKSDMEKAVPMDRLILGDVGYGKTEIAVRAAFKAVQDGKQVALLAPTTLLAQQHLDTFNERYTGFPVTVRGLSRFQNPADSKATVEGIADGSVDIVIGTHRLLTGNVRFKDLGLLIIDEEQRFGVEHKETLKALRTNVDVLSMSATPIPRTLEMAVTGIRELSILATPPEERHPVLTYVGAQEDKQVTAAIRRELLREGQVFYIHNRVEDIDRVAAHLRELVPDARVQVAHGKMNEHQLERVIVDFWEREFDVLVCTTTIVETGLDIANANTLIVENADKFGLSQLHQLRGRVGRSSERAYSYFLYNATKPLTELAHDRLTTLATRPRPRCRHEGGDEGPRVSRCGHLLGGEQSGPHRRGRLRPVRTDGRRGGRRLPRRGQGSGEGDPCGAPAGRPHPSRLHRLRTPAPGGLLQACRRARGVRDRPGPRRALRPLRRTAGLGRGAAGRGPIPDRCPRGGGRRGPGAGQDDPFRASRGPGLRRDEDEAPPPGNGAQARHPAGAGAAADDLAPGRHRAARPRAARMGPRDPAHAGARRR